MIRRFCDFCPAHKEVETDYYEVPIDMDGEDVVILISSKVYLKSNGKQRDIDFDCLQKAIKKVQ
tara:strand:+ start:2938 stop:3129 length:192 start_codon:yes stop_codon:yes gene_type:complete